MIEVGTKVLMDGEKQRYTVQASDERFIILTKPFNAKRTYIYTIVDLEQGIRGPCNLIFGLPEDCDTPEGASVCLKWLNGFEDEFGGGDMQVSARRHVKLTENELEQLK